MQSAAENVKIVDGKLKIDLSSSGMDIVSGVDELKSNLTDGIHELASAEIEIIDAEIKVLEVLAAMEDLGDIDVDMDNNGINFEAGDIFDPNGVNGFSSEMNEYLTALQGIVEDSETLKATF